MLSGMSFIASREFSKWYVPVTNLIAFGYGRNTKR